MQKKLVTDTLIEEYQKELKQIKSRLYYYGSIPDEKTLLAKNDLVSDFITRLQSLRQQEVQNVIDAAYDITSKYVDVRCSDGYLKQKANDYFTSTFQQEKGGVENGK